MARSKKLEKNLQNVQDMLDGNFQRKIQVGFGDKAEEHRKVGDRWTDSDGVEWEQKNGYRTKISGVNVGMFSKVCKNCEKPCTSQMDIDTYNRMTRCYYCQIDFEARLKTWPIKWWAWVKLQELQRWAAIDKETEAIVFQNSENKWNDKSIANALANSEVEMTIKKTKDMS